MSVLRHARKPLVESAPARGADTQSESWIVVESGGNAMNVARDATSRMIDLLVHAGTSPCATPVSRVLYWLTKKPR